MAGLKRLWGFGKARYRGLATNANRAFTPLAMVTCTWPRDECRNRPRGSSPLAGSASLASSARALELESTPPSKANRHLDSVLIWIVAVFSESLSSCHARRATRRPSYQSSRCGQRANVILLALGRIRGHSSLSEGQLARTSGSEPGRASDRATAQQRAAVELRAAPFASPSYRHSNWSSRQ